MIANRELTKELVKIYEETLRQKDPDISEKDFADRVESFRRKLDNIRSRQLKPSVQEINPGWFLLNII